MVLKIVTYGMHHKPLNEVYDLSNVSRPLKKKIERLDNFMQDFDDVFLKNVFRADKRAQQFGESDEFVKETLLFADMSQACENKLDEILKKYNIPIKAEHKPLQDIYDSL